MQLLKKGTTIVAKKCNKSYIESNYFFFYVFLMLFTFTAMTFLKLNVILDQFLIKFVL